MPRLIGTTPDPMPRVKTITVELERELALALCIICNNVGGPPERIRGLFLDGRESTQSLGFILRRALGREGAWPTEKLEEHLGSTMHMKGNGGNMLGSIWFEEL